MEPQQPQLFELEEQQSTIIVVPFEELDPATQAWIERIGGEVEQPRTPQW